VTSIPKFLFYASGELHRNRYKATTELLRWFSSARCWNVGFLAHGCPKRIGGACPQLAKADLFRRPFRRALPRPLEGRKQDDGAAPDPPQAPLVAARRSCLAGDDRLAHENDARRNWTGSGAMNITSACSPAPAEDGSGRRDEHPYQQERQEDECKNDPPNAPLGPILHRLNVHSRALKRCSTTDRPPAQREADSAPPYSAL
jgi:hypothetical protein